MMRAGVPLLQAFDIVAKGTTNNAVAKLFMDIKQDVETGSSLSAPVPEISTVFRFTVLQSGGRRRTGGYSRTTCSIGWRPTRKRSWPSRARSNRRLFYPAAVLAVAAIVVTVIMLFVIPAFKDVFSSFGADLPAPTLIIIAMSDYFTKYWYLIFGITGGTFYFLMQAWRRSPKVQMFMDKLMLKLPIFGSVMEKATVARWLRTLGTMFAAGVPLVEALDSVGGACGNYVYLMATKKIQQEVSTGTSLTVSMQNVNLFPNMVIQMAMIGEESGSLDGMLGKAADIYEREVDEAVASLSSLMEPLIMVFLGVLIGGLVVAMYLPIFKLGQVV